MVKSEQFNPTPQIQKRRWLLLLLPPSFSLILLASLMVHEARHPAAWSVELERYLTAPQMKESKYTLVSTLTATWPERLRAQMPFHPAGESVYYLTAASDPRSLVGSDGRKPLPYPPTEVWCFLLQNPAGAQKVILIARHDDIYNADWLVHEPEEDSAEIAQSLAQIGCQF